MRYLQKVWKWLFGIIVVLIFCLPVVFLLAGSLKGTRKLTDSLGAVIAGKGGDLQWNFFPAYPTLRHYVKVLFDSPQFWTLFWNSVKLTGVIVFGQILISIPAAWGFARYRFTHTIFRVYMILMMIPFQVRMISEYLLLQRMDLLDSFWGIVLPAIFSAYPVFIMFQFFVSIPEEVLDAARIDGANEWQLFVRIGVPLGKTGIISSMMLSVLECWNMIEQPMVFLDTKSRWPVALYVPQITENGIGVSFAVSILVLILPFLVFLAGQEYIQKGIAAFMKGE